MKNKRLYIAYGSNLNVRQMAMRCPTAKIVSTGILKNYELQFKGSPTSAFATIKPSKGLTVPVIVWELQRKDEQVLDLYEGYPSHYYKQNITVNMGNTEVTAMVYIMGHKNDFGIPSHRYYNTLLEGYDKAGFDVNILNDAVDKSIAEYRKIQNDRFKINDFENYYDLFDDNEQPREEEDNEEDEDFDLDNQQHF